MLKDHETEEEARAQRKGCRAIDEWMNEWMTSCSAGQEIPRRFKGLQEPPVPRICIFDLHLRLFIWFDCTSSPVSCRTKWTRLEVRVNFRGPLFAYLPVKVLQARDPWRRAEGDTWLSYMGLEKNLDLPREYMTVVPTASAWNWFYFFIGGGGGLNKD
jgi:hypothetical protein